MDEGRSGAGGLVVPANRVRVIESGVRIGDPKGADRHGEPKVQLVREDGVIRAIEITCSCGELIRIKCDYS